MSDFALIDLDAQADAFARHVQGWKAEDVLELMRKYGEVRVIPMPHADKAYSFRSSSGIQTGFRFTDEGRLVIVKDHTFYLTGEHGDYKK